jgi:hypothetical protein
VTNTEDLFQQALENCPEIVRWAFKNKPENFYTINETFDIEGSSSTLIRLLSNLKFAEELKNTNCSNIQEKFAEANSWSKFLSLGSELFFAYEFVKLGFEVSLILDNSPEFKKANRQDKASPDISIKKDGRQFLVEVARISDDETQLEIANKINPIIKENSFRVRIKYSEEFSIPAIRHEERTERENLIKDFVNKFREIIQTIDSNSLPNIQNILDCQVEFSESLEPKGYYAGCRTSIITNPGEKIQLQIKNELERKAKKRQQWEDLQKSLLYLVALDIQQNLFFEHKLISLLFGGQCYRLPQFYGKPGDPNFPSYSEPAIVTSAKENGWKYFLENVGFDPRSSSHIHEPGIFISDPIFENVTGVIARMQNNQSFGAYPYFTKEQFNPLRIVPNPFAEKQINCLDLEEIIPWRTVKDIYKSS